VEARLPAHLEVGGLIRRAQAEGGFASVLQSGERDAGTILVVLTERGENARVFERLPRPDGVREWSLRREQDSENKQEFEDWLSRRGHQDPDLWIVELDIANGERFIRSD
jgi:hypothetical protein